MLVTVQGCAYLLGLRPINSFRVDVIVISSFNVLDMWTLNILIILIQCTYMWGLTLTEEADEPILYYYGLEESEQGLPACMERQACSVLLMRYWQPAALVRLCRCARRNRCDSRTPPDRQIELNNRAYFQFCKPTTDWPLCSITDTPVNVETLYERMNPDELEELHHQNIQLVPPNITFNCKCRNPNYWRLKSNDDENHTTHVYQCSSLSLCETDEYCGNVNYDLNSLYQSCLCPKNHICVHNGGVPNDIISELLYHGKGWKAYCRRINQDNSYDDY